MLTWLITLLFPPKKKTRVLWTEQHIRLYEKQMAAIEEIGEKWCLHPRRSMPSHWLCGPSLRALGLPA